MSSLQEDFEVELECADGVTVEGFSTKSRRGRRWSLREFESLQHGRVQDTKDANGVVLAADVELDSRRVALEEGGVCGIC